MDIPDVNLLDEILADMSKQNGPAKQSINPSAGINGTTNNDNSSKSVRFTQPTPPPPPPIIKEQTPNSPLPPRTPTPNGLPNGRSASHQQPLQIIVDTLHVPGDRSFLHSPSGDILQGNGGPVTPVMRTPSPRADYGLKSPTVLTKTTTGGWIPEQKHADASEGCPVFTADDKSEEARFQSYHLDYKYTPPPIKGPCCVCGDGIMGAMVTAMDKMWHPEHFCCVHCHKELRPPHFTEHAGQPYCKACHNMLFLPPCAGCNRDIQGNYIQPMGKVWHPDCFRCNHCQKVLPPDNFFERNGKPYCDDCRHELFSPKCYGCKKPIKDDRKVTALGVQFHPTCFKCCKCNGVMSPSNYKEKDNRLYCENCYNDTFMPKCASCKTPILQSPTNAMGKQWHPQCFKCTDCRKILTPEKFRDNGGKPYCDDCFHNRFSERCAGCKQPIKDPKRKVMAQGKAWHPEHFTCTECHKQLDPNKFWEKNGLPYCEDDFHRLFSAKCAGCSQPIKNPKNMVTAQGKKWHPEHFNCCVCHKQLDPNNFWEKDGKAYCEDDFHKLFSPKCAGCSQPIKNPQNMVTAQGKKWHPEHFNCTVCHKQLDPNNFWEKDGKAYCEDDYHKLFSPKCAGCMQPIKTKALVALGQHWHPEHFCCCICGKTLDEFQFYERDGKPYCVDDYLRLFAPHCKECKKPITDPYCLSALGGDWHADCFRCRDCHCLLEDVNFFEINGEPYCEQHFHARQCPDCVRVRRAQNEYFGLAPDTPMQVRKWASQVSLKSLEINGGNGGRPLSQMSQYSQYSSTYELNRSGTPTNQSQRNSLQRQGSNTHIIPIEREGASSSLSQRSSRNDNLHHFHDHNGQMCLHDHQVDQMQRSVSQMSMQSQNGHSNGRSSEQQMRERALGGKGVTWKKSQDNLQYIAKNQSPYVYNEPGRFPLTNEDYNGQQQQKQIRFEERMTKREYEAVQKHY